VDIFNLFPDVGGNSFSFSTLNMVLAIVLSLKKTFVFDNLFLSFYYTHTFTVQHVYDSKETSTEEKPWMFSTVLWMLDSFFSWHHPTSPKDMHHLDKSKVFTLSLKIRIPTFTLPFGHHLLFGRHVLQN
jgi:hypothetical protein